MVSCAICDGCIYQRWPHPVTQCLRVENVVQTVWSLAAPEPSPLELPLICRERFLPSVGAARSKRLSPKDATGVPIPTDDRACPVDRMSYQV